MKEWSCCERTEIKQSNPQDWSKFVGDDDSDVVAQTGEQQATRTRQSGIQGRLKSDRSGWVASLLMEMGEILLVCCNADMCRDVSKADRSIGQNGGQEGENVQSIIGGGKAEV